MSFEELISAPVEQEQTKVQKGRSARRRVQPIAGGLPTVSLLPPEIRDAARSRVLRRGMVALVLAAGVAVAGATALAGAAAGAADQSLADANGQTAGLTRQLGKFADVQRLQSSVAVGEAAKKVGTSTQIDWNEQIGLLLADLPYGYTLQSITADSASAVVDYPQGSNDPLERPRAATVQLNLAAPSIQQLSPWLRELRSVPAYADATASYDKADESGYTVTVLLHLSSKAIERLQEDQS